MKKSANKSEPTWNLKLLYKSATDPQIEKDVQAIERVQEKFAKKYNTPAKKYLTNPKTLLTAIRDIEKMLIMGEKPLSYFWYLRDLEAEHKVALSKIPLLENRLTIACNKTSFFTVLLGKIPFTKQKEFLSDKKLAPYKIYLKRIFDDAKYDLSVAEEKIMNLKSQPAYNMWLSGNEKILNMQSVSWRGRKIPIAEAMNIVRDLPKPKDRAALARAITKVLKEKVAPFSEAEINAVVTNKKINDELRGFRTPHENTILSYRNDPKVVENLVVTVTKAFPIAQRFFRLKARLLKQKSLSYADRAAKIGTIRSKYPFKQSVQLIKDAFGKIDPKYPKILDQYVAQGQIDVPSRIGKTGGAYCSGSYSLPTFVLLNHVDSLNSLTTLAHEMGHAFHTELSKTQKPLYFHYSTSLAETASTLFESIALEAVFDSLSDKEKIVVLHDRISDSIATVFRQVACFNFEKEIHSTIRAKGFMNKEELADLHNKHMRQYLGPVCKLTRDDGYFFVQWSHIRRFFYVYSYAYGMLVSQALLRRYKQDKAFWPKIEQFLSSGGNDSPENILRGIGVDVSKSDFWLVGLKEIEDDIKKLEKLV